MYLYLLRPLLSQEPCVRISTIQVTRALPISPLPCLRTSVKAVHFSYDFSSRSYSPQRRLQRFRGHWILSHMNDEDTATDFPLLLTVRTVSQWLPSPQNEDADTPQSLTKAWSKLRQRFANSNRYGGTFKADPVDWLCTRYVVSMYITIRIHVTICR